MDSSKAIPSTLNSPWTIDLSHILGDAPPIAVDFKLAARLIGVSRSTIRRLSQSGALPTTRIGRRRVVSIDALRDLVKNGASVRNE